MTVLPLLLSLTALSLATSFAQVSVYVDCDGGADSAAGTSSSPIRTLAHARDLLRAAAPLSAPASVFIAGDCLPRAANAAAANFSLTTLYVEAADRGTPDAPITGTFWPGRAAPRLLGGVAVPASAWSPAPAPAAPGVVTADLGPAGLDVAKYGFGALGSGGLGTCSDSATELFAGGAAQVLARYPNIAADGTWQWIEVSKVENAETQFAINGSDAARALTWPNASTPGGSAWLHGYWSFDWADSYVQMEDAASDGAGSTIISVMSDTPPVYGFLPNARFYATNILSELDASGEYFVDAAAARLYWMPPPGGVAAAGEVVLSVAESLVSMAPGAALANVNFQGLSFLYARGDAVQLSGANLSVAGCTSALHGHTGVLLTGANVELRDSTVFGTGCKATSMSGGDLATLAPSGNRVVNNTMHGFARVVRTYNPGIAFYDVGGLYADNHVFNGPHTGITGGGALNLFVGNLLESLLFESSDAGAFYTGYSWTNRGNVVRNNTFRNIRPTERTFLGYPSVQAIYLDDEQSGYVIEDNVCDNAVLCYFVGGGRDNIVRNNVCKNSGTCLHLDDRGLNWQHASCIYNATYTGKLVQELYDVKYQQPPYSTAFPEIVTTLAREPCTPVNVSFLSNSACNTTTLIDTSQANLAAWGDVFSGNTNTSVC